MTIQEFYQKLHTTFQNNTETAYKYYDTTLSFQEMGRLMLKINTVLSSHNQNSIAVYSHKGINHYCALFSIILSNNIWTPLNPEIPQERIESMLTTAKSTMLLYEEDLPDWLKQFAQKHSITLHSLTEIINQESPTPFTQLPQKENDLAYIMFTSGSTGKPKGVPMTHLNYINFIDNALNILPFTDNEVFADFHDLGFDISIFYLFCAPLTKSALSPALTPKDKLLPHNFIKQNNVSVLATVPTLINQIKTLNKDNLFNEQLNILFLCGEPLRLDLLPYTFDTMRAKHVYNFYGLTETGVENFFHKCLPKDKDTYKHIGFAPIGKPLPGNPIMLGENSELYISGCQITPGYLGDKSHSRKKSINNIDWFCTGDKVIEENGVYFCKGRLDSQVKIAGHRVELMDIEAQLRNITPIQDAVCFLLERQQRQTLVAAILSHNPLKPDNIQKQLKSNLPNYMIPQEFLFLDEFPKNKSGKTDRLKIKNNYHKQHT